MSKRILRFPRWTSTVPTIARLISLLACGAFGARWCMAEQPVDPAPAIQPATQPAVPIDPAVRALVAKLGDEDPAVRDDATHKLSDLGKAAIPALRQAAEGDDPEAASRARVLLRQIERHIPPPAPPHDGRSHSRSVSMSMNQGVRTIDVDDDGRKIHILSQPDGSLEMSVTGVENGKEVTETYKARDAGELKKDNPEAFAIYDQWSGAGGRIIIRGRLGVGMPLLPGMPPGVAPIQPPNPQGPQDLQLRIEQQQKQIEELQRRLAAEAEQRVHDRMRGEGGKDQAPPEKQPPAPDADKPGDGSKQPDKADDKPQTRPQ